MTTNSISPFLNTTQVQKLIDLYHETPKTVKSTGPTVVEYEKICEHPVMKEFLKEVESKLTPFTVLTGNFYYTEKPYIIHVDNVGMSSSPKNKSLIFPLELYPEENQTPGTCFVTLFNQTYDVGPVKFFFDDEGLPGHTYHLQYNRARVANIDYDPATQEDPELDHLKKSWLWGLTIRKHIPWDIGSLITFNSNTLHTSSNFKKKGIHAKLGLVLFVEYK